MSIEDMEKRVIMLEDRMLNMDKNITLFGAYLETARSVQEKFSITMEKISDTIAQVQITLTKMEDKLTSNSDDIAGVKKDVGDLKKSIEDVDDKGKFDFVKFIRDNAVGFLIGGGAAYILSLLMDTVLKK
jgi:predicted  nucleic acid-binding Zn-ribbon protein